MANILDLMDIKQIISLQMDGLSNRRISEILGISRNTVNSYIRTIDSSAYSAQELLGFDEQRLSKIFPGRTTIQNDRYNQLMLFEFAFDSKLFKRSNEFFV